MLEKRIIVRFIFYFSMLFLIAYGFIGMVIYLKLSHVSVGYSDPVNVPSRFYVDGSSLVQSKMADFYVENYREVTFFSEKNKLKLSAWFLPSDARKEAIIVLPGYRRSKADFRPLIIAGMLRNYGQYNVLILDVRDTGRSEVEDARTSMGHREYQDVITAKEWLFSQGISQVGVMGVSMGGSTGLIAFSQDESIRAVLADSAYVRIKDIIKQELVKEGYPKFFWLSGILSGKIIFRDNLLKYDIADSVKKANGRYMMIFHGKKDPRVSISHGEELLSVAKKVKMNHFYHWFYDDDAHVMMLLKNSDEYKERMLNFFDEAFSSSSR